ncbi:hypothetical protein COV24_01185 [candidate division WWE3 bacterium CG10_big_fil_rev_8_21_14_0_10_32_10]|uniref:Oligoendopeptidase F n=1 Tax=candidate division WWE3 bacterium CG10_big_fil_rev_8_21_14_0_10_32_10 TaxID=1975090 RepID=A0A2H0RB38_UNCKA|nr:MAG: hypothetical protein COV24_01185 [candidate division WWE3 bacterium CG10_big_fil_rev_8_21_14_0_10_32_10]
MFLKTTKNEWDFSALYGSDSDKKIELDKKKVKEQNYNFINKWKNSKDYLKNPIVLKQALIEYENLNASYGSSGDFGYYFWLRSTQDQNDTTIKAFNNTIDDFSTKIANDIQFFEMRLAKISPEKQTEFLKSPELKEYHHFLKILFQNAKYLLSEKEEKILNLKSSVSHSNWVNMLSGILAKQEKEILVSSNKKEKRNFSQIIGKYINDKNKKVRDSAANAFNNILVESIDVAENEINSVLQNKKITDELRGFTRPDEARHISDDIDTKVVDTLIKVVSDSYDISKRYYKLKAKLHGYKKLAYHERNLDYGKVTKKYTYQESVDLVYTVFSNLDKKFADIFKDYIENGRVDVFPKKGKSSGAFCAHNLKTQPTYILLNHTNKLSDVLTIAHEAGHGINNELMKKQNSFYFGTSLAVAEVASTFMEDFVLQEILKNADDELKLSILMQKLNEDISTIIRQTAFYKFEWDLHKQFRKKGYLSKEEIGVIFQKHMKSYMGKYVSQDKGSENWWVYVGHFRSFFYVYSYASGLLISKSLQAEVKKDPKFILKVKSFLSAGSSKSPKDLFLDLGINITKPDFWESGIKELEELLIKTETLARKLGKI